MVLGAHGKNRKKSRPSEKNRVLNEEPGSAKPKIEIWALVQFKSGLARMKPVFLVVFPGN